MIPARQMLLAALLIWAAALLQGRAAHAVAVHGAQPDFPLVVLSGCAILVGGARGSLLGFWTGLLAAAAFPQAYGSVFAGRIAAGAFAAWFGSNLIRGNWLVPPLVVLAATVLAELISVLIAPEFALHHAHSWLTQTGGEILFNTLLALPVYGLLRCCRIGVVRENPFGQRL